MNRLADEQLIARCASGDGCAMDVLVSRYHGKLMDFAVRHLRDREASADVAQMALLRVFESAVAFRGQSSFRTWLYAIALNLVRDNARRRTRRPESLFSDLAGGDVAEVHAPDSAEDAALGQITSIALWQAVEYLPEHQRTAVILRFRADLAYGEIAEVMGVPVGTVRSWMHYALKALRRSFDGEEEICAAKNTNLT